MIRHICDMAPDDVMKRWPRLVAHMVCESLGYFTPKMAAEALLKAKLGKPYFCEWYSYLSQFRNEERDLYNAKSILEVTVDVPKWAIANRHRHHGYMAELNDAKRCIEAELAGRGPEFASWF